jgi:hypothetical protein
MLSYCIIVHLEAVGKLANTLRHDSLFIAAIRNRAF